MAYYYSIPIEEMDEELESLRFYPVSLTFRNKPVKEWVYERKLPRSPNHFVRIYTGINRYGPSAGESRQAGKDAIRIQVIYRDTKGETLVSQTKRVHRVGGWRKNLHKRMNEVATELPQVQFDSRGEPMTLRKKGKDYFWGSRDYPKYKETKPFRAEEIRCCKECNKTTGLTTIQAGTYCYDCLPINLGAEDRLDYRDYLNDLRSYPELKNLSDEQLLARGIDCLASQTANQEKNSEDNQSDNLIWDEEAGLFYDYIQLPQPDGELIVPYWILNEELDQVGKAQISLFNNNLEIDSIFIEPYYQRRGIATSFVNHVVNYWDSELLRFSDAVSDEGVAFIDSFAADDYDATYGKEQAKIRRKLKNKIKKQAIMGTKAGQWSARKSQELKRQYEAACDKKGLNPYKGKKTKSQDNLSKWSKQKWGTASGRKSSVTGEPYFPAKAVAALKKKDLYAKAKRQKAKATRAGKQNARYSDDIRKVVAKYRAESPDWEDIDWKTDEPPAKKGPEDWGDDVEWDAEMEWKFPIHDINSMEELIDIYESRERYDNGKLKPYRKAWTHMNLIRSNLFRINFSGVYSCRVIANSSKIIYGNNMLDDLKKGWNSQQTISPVFSRRGTRHRVVSAETPYIPQNKEATLDELITTLKNNNVGWLAKGGSYGPKNLLVFDMKGIVFAIDATPMWSGNIPKTSNWRQLRLDREPLRIKGVLQNGEIEIYGGVPKENVIYETIPSEPYNYADVVKTKTIADLWDAESYLERDEITMKEFDETTADDFVKDSDEQIALMLRKKSKINRYGDIGCPVCGSIGLFSEEIIAKGKKWYCYGCLYEDKEETIKGKGDITLEKYGLEITCPICKKGIKAFNNDSMLRHMKKCGVPK